MKIAFVGKGGSGKSTLTALYIKYLQQKGRPVLAVDADLNMNLSGLLGASFPREKSLANPAIAKQFREHLKGTNERVADANKFLPTTPPGKGSNIISSYNDPALDFCAVQVDPSTALLTVGTYEKESIGQHCYHSDLFVAENLLSHAVAKNFDIVCDMVAGTDAFAYSLHLQFDAIILISEPTPESAEVCALYKNLAQESGIQSIIHLVANKIVDKDDLQFVERKIGATPLGAIPMLPSLKKSRQNGNPIEYSPELSELMEKIDHAARYPSLSESERMIMLYRLHEKLNGKEWVKMAYGDVMSQIDASYNREEAA